MKLTLRMKKRTNPQKAISESQARFNIASWGRQSGKTTFGIDKMTFRPLMGRALGVYWYILQTASAAEIAFNRHWHELKKAPHLMLDKPNESEKKVTLINGATVFYKSGHNFEDLRAETLDGAIIDEVRQQSPKLWSMVIRPMLTKRKGWCDFYSTPNGFDHFYDLFEAAKTKKNWGTFHAPSSAAWWWDADELEMARSELSEAEYAQEIDAEFRNIHVGKAYKCEGEWNRMTVNPFTFNGEAVSKFLPVVVGLDFNVGNMSWHLGQFRGKRSHWFDEIHISDTNTMECAEVLGERLVKLKMNGLLGANPNVILCGDASGKARHTSATESDYAIICAKLDALGITWSNETPDANPAVMDRVNTMNARLRAANGLVTMTYNPITCPKLKKDFDRVAFKEGTSILDQIKDKSLTHASDSVGYPVCRFSPIELNGAVGTLHVIGS